MRHAPCKNCQNRDYGCHTYCQDYLKYCIEQEILKRQRHKKEQAQLATDPDAKVRNRSTAFNGRGRS